MTKYNVALSNDSAIFDSCDGFDSVAEALEWASGRGGTYVIQLVRETNGDVVDFVSISATVRKGKTTYSRYLPGGWIYVSPEQIADMI